MLKQITSSLRQISFRSTSSPLLQSARYSAGFGLVSRRTFADAASGASKSIFVGNLPWEVSDSDINEFFGKYGNITNIKIMKDNQTGRPRGFAFVTLEGDADKAISELDGKELKGRSLRVNEAKPPAPRDPNNRFQGDRGFNRGGDRGDRGDRGFQGGDRRGERTQRPRQTQQQDDS
eukprot:TRINITY_DN4552_c0_g1_i1.p2 TRINITY_DN4552_c0_g1~~TRINITY_DN4552_c0_g1_i1.p2  ORF type:complete len:177 (-),score=38.94 TRINITY_DN4552_c0_g1_i1:179-709(-)